MRPSLSPRRKERCIDIIRALMARQISRIFSEPVDPELDKCGDYFEIISRPMDLGTVLKNLEQNKYMRYSEFFKDVDLIWKNARDYNGTASLITVFACQLRDWFMEMTRFMSDDEEADWYARLSSLQREIASLHDAHIIDPAPPEPVIDGIQSMSDDMETQKETPPMKQKKAKMTYRETEELTDLINSLDNEETIVRVLTIMKREEPNLGLTGEPVVNMLHLAASTRIKIREYIMTVQ